MKCHSLCLIIFSVIFLSCKGNNMKVKIYYNTSEDLTDIYRTIDFVKNGQYKYLGFYNFVELGINDFDFIKNVEGNKQFDTRMNIFNLIQESDKNHQLVNIKVTEHGIENFISMSMYHAETVFEIFDSNDEIIFSYLYFEDEEYFLDIKNDKVYLMTEEIRTFSKKVIDRVVKDDNSK